MGLSSLYGAACFPARPRSHDNVIKAKCVVEEGVALQGDPVIANASVLTFLDLIAKQVASMKAMYRTDPTFMLMNSFSTSEDTFEALAKYPKLGTAT